MLTKIRMNHTKHNHKWNKMQFSQKSEKAIEEMGKTVDVDKK